MVNASEAEAALAARDLSPTEALEATGCSTLLELYEEAADEARMPDTPGSEVRDSSPAVSE